MINHLEKRRTRNKATSKRHFMTSKTSAMVEYQGILTPTLQLCLAISIVNHTPTKGNLTVA